MKSALICLLLMAACSFTGSAQKRHRKKSTPESYFTNIDSLFKSYTGKPFPAFDFVLNNKKHVSNGRAAGKAVLIDLWFEACHPCHAAFNALNELHDSLRRRKNVVFFSIAREPQERLRELTKKYRLRYPMTTAPDSVCNRYTLGFSFPTLLLGDGQGRIAYFRSGGEMDSTGAREEIMGTIYPKILSLLRK